MQTVAIYHELLFERVCRQIVFNQNNYIDQRLISCYRVLFHRVRKWVLAAQPSNDKKMEIRYL